jgi:hypothetical protein
MHWQLFYPLVSSNTLNQKPENNLSIVLNSYPVILEIDASFFQKIKLMQSLTAAKFGIIKVSKATEIPS